MAGELEGSKLNETDFIRIRYWAAARAAAGVTEERLRVTGALTLADVLAHVRAAHPGDAFARLIAICSVLVDDVPSATGDPASHRVGPGQTVEFLPPFAGG